MKPPEKPDNLLSKDKMVEVLYDMSLVTAAKSLNRKLVENSGLQPAQYIYDKHDIDSLQFANSNDYYAYDVKGYQEMYDRVRIKLQKDKTYFNGRLEIENKKRDSITKVNKRRRDSIAKINASKDSTRTTIITPSPPKSIDSSQ